MNKKNCKQCGEEFYKPYTESRKNWTNHIFCSVKCSNIARKGKKFNNALDIYYLTHSKDTSGLKPGWNKGKPWSEKVKKHMSELKKGITFNTGRTHFKKGEKPWNYRGVTPQTILDRNKFVSTIGKEVMKRDDYTCCMCGTKGGFLHVDHIQPWAEYVEGRFCMDNCRTLCRKCHYKITFNKDMPEDSLWGLGKKYLYNYNVTRRTT